VPSNVVKVTVGSGPRMRLIVNGVEARRMMEDWVVYLDALGAAGAVSATIENVGTLPLYWGIGNLYWTYDQEAQVIIDDGCVDKMPLPPGESDAIVLRVAAGGGMVGIHHNDPYNGWADGNSSYGHAVFWRIRTP
jgi:hypothetical protein